MGTISGYIFVKKRRMKALRLDLGDIDDYYALVNSPLKPRDYRILVLVEGKLTPGDKRLYERFSKKRGYDMVGFVSNT